MRGDAPTFISTLAVIGATVGAADTAAGLAVLEGPALRAIVRERLDQVEKHGFTLDHDLGHSPQALGLAALTYLDVAIDQLNGIGIRASAAAKWPFADGFNPVADIRGNIAKATAIAWAMLDRVQQAPAAVPDEGPAIDPAEDTAGLAAWVDDKGRMFAVDKNNRVVELGDDTDLSAIVDEPIRSLEDGPTFVAAEGDDEPGAGPWFKFPFHPAACPIGHWIVTNDQGWYAKARWDGETWLHSATNVQTEYEPTRYRALKSDVGPACLLCGCMQHKACVVDGVPCAWSTSFPHDVPICTACEKRAIELSFKLDRAQRLGLRTGTRDVGFTCADAALIAERKLRMIERCRSIDSSALEYIDNWVDDAGPAHTRAWFDERADLENDVPF